MKKSYFPPDIKVIRMHQQQLLNPNSVQTTGLESSKGLVYDKDGGNQEEAW